ncbi:MAG: His/Gly/Thr/Pro-type tRNA ligase C-terminal domain-containing protein, partial [Bacilli bacterium]
DSKLYEMYKEKAMDLLKDFNIDTKKLRYKDHEKLAHYAKEACDIEYKFPFGWGEVWGTHNRTNYDLSRHQEFSKRSMEYLDPETNEKYIPYVVESSVGCDRLTLTVLMDAYKQDTLENGEVRERMAFIPALAPYKVAVLPLMKKYHTEKANEIYNLLSKEFMTSYDEAGNIGKRYRRQDIMGTPFCITIDDETLNNNKVTLRDRDSMEQITLDINELVEYIEKKVRF